MKISDYKKQNIIISVAITVFIFYKAVTAFRSGELAGKNAVIWAVCCVALVISLARVCIYTYRSYDVGPGGIDMTSCFGLIKMHYDWHEMKCFLLSSVSTGGKHSHNIDIIVLSKLERSQIPYGNFDSLLWYQRRFRDIVMFKFTPERYEYICRYCRLPFLDNG